MSAERELRELYQIRRWLRVLLHAYPKDFRDAFGQDLERTYVDWYAALRARGSRRAKARVLSSAIWHSARDGLMEHVTGGRRGREGRMGSLTTDIRMALRSLRQAPGFTAAAVLVLALGVGANTTSFGALKVATLARPPFPDAERLVSLDLTRRSGDGERYSRWAYPYFEMLEEWEGRLVDPVAAYRHFDATVTELGPALGVPIEMVSTGYFDVVGLPLAVGRGFAPEEGRPGAAERVVIVSHAFWRTRLEGSPSAIGREIRLNDASHRVIGVGPRGFRGLLGNADLWVPHGSYDVFQPGVLGQAGNHVAWVAGRLQPHASLEAATDQMRIIGEAVGDRWPRSDRYGAGLRTFAEIWTNPAARTASQLLTLAAALVLLVACANLSGLLLARGRRRVRAGAVRRALGASRWRLIRASLIESLVIALLGGTAAIAVSSWGTRMLSMAWPQEFLTGTDTGLRVVDPAGLGLDASVLTFALAVSVVAALLIGVLPAVRASSEQVTEHLKGGTSTVASSMRLGRTDAQAALVGGQISLALVLVLAVGALGTSVGKLLDVDVGFRPERLLTFEYTRPSGVPRLDPSDPQVWRDHITLSAQFDDRMKRRLSALPGVEGVAISGSTLLEGFQAVIGVTEVEGRPAPGGSTSIGVVTVDPECFETLGFTLVSGRGFTETDGLGGDPAVVLNQRAVELYFGGENPVGRRFGVGFALSGRQTAEVVGVVGDILHIGPDRERWPVAYYSTRERRHGSHALVRTAGNPTEALELIRAEMNELDPTVAISNVATVEERIRASIGDRTMILVLLGIFGGVTVLLVAVGTWAVISYSVADRARELAVRLALGAEGGGIVRLVMRQVAVVAVLGGILGLAGGLGGTHVLQGFLFNTSPRDPRVILVGCSFILAVVSLASYLPARRATRVDPARELKALE